MKNSNTKDEQVAPPKTATGTAESATAPDVEPAGSAKSAQTHSVGDAVDSMPAEETRTENSSLEEQLQAAIAERESNYEQFKRAQAELDNYRKRVQKEHEQIRLYQTLPLIRDQLPGLDNLQRAIQAAQKSGNVDELVQGVQMVAAQFEDILAKHSVQPIEAVGQPFDPNLHEAVQQMPSADQPAMTVLDEVERGYVLHDRVIRPSKVIVSCALPEEGPADTETEDSEQEVESDAGA